MSTRSARLAARAVYEAALCPEIAGGHIRAGVEPSALMVELCRERIGKQLVMPREHKEAVANYARGFATTNPHRHHEWVHHLDNIQGDAEARLTGDLGIKTITSSQLHVGGAEPVDQRSTLWRCGGTVRREHSAVIGEEGW
eukprot:Skav200799  [mRNA]  locus=scaffold959:147416:149566:+ [translate_table: standard]